MKAETIIEVVESLVGPIHPVGETHTDGTRYENLRVMTHVIDRLLFEIDSVARQNKDRHEDSMCKAGKFAAKFINEVKAEY